MHFIYKDYYMAILVGVRVESNVYFKIELYSKSMSNEYIRRGGTYKTRLEQRLSDTFLPMHPNCKNNWA